MAFGLLPKHIEDFPLDNLTIEQFLVLAIETAKKLNWNVSYTSEIGFVAFTKFSMSSWSEEVKVKIEGNNANLKSECIGNQIIDWGKNKKNIENFISTFSELKDTFTPEELTQKYEELKPNLVSKEQAALNQPPPTTKEGITSVFAIFKPTQGYFITPILINLNIAIFILMIISGVNFMRPSNESLLNWGANFRPITLEGEWWRLVTNCFLHIGIFHLLMNMYALLYIGVLLEPHLGKARFTAAYLLTSITASITSLWWYDLTISAGASGSIFGMYGVFLAMLTTNLIEKSARKVLLISIAVFVGYNLINGLKGGIDNAAHIGGLLSGFVIGYAFMPSLKKPGENKLKFGTIGLLSILILVSSFVVYKKLSNDAKIKNFISMEAMALEAYKKLPNDTKTYDAKIKDFISMEAMALEVYKLPPNTPKDEILYEIKDRGIYYWNENIKLLNSFKNLDLPLKIRAKNKLLKEYCEIRIKCYELLYKTISEDTDQYKLQIEEYNKQIDTKIKELSGGQ